MKLLTTTELQRQRTIHNFDKRYAASGGVTQLLAMVKDHASLRLMADTFHTTPQNISRLLKVILGHSYANHLRQAGISRGGVEQFDEEI